MFKLSDREWAVLNVLWERQGAELGELVEALRPTTGWSRNTVFTYLTRMEAKGLVTIDKSGYPSVYRPALDRARCQAMERRDFLDRVYGGAAGELVASFLREEPISPDEVAQLRKLLDEMEV